jgi:ABC-2 type transport system permease protein
MFGHNFGTVFSFEVVRTLKKKSFWLAIIAFPALIVAVMGVVLWSNQQANEADKDLASQQFSIGITDNSGVIPKDIFDAINAETIGTRAEGIEKVRSGALDAFFYYPENLTDNKVEVYGQNVGIFQNSRYQSVAQALLQQSATAQTSPDIAAILKGDVTYNNTTYRDGEVYDPMAEMIVPGVFLVLLYVIIAIFGNQMLNATVEEKENRVMEIILTTIKSRTLIVGKIFAMLALILIQVIVIIGLILIAYLLLRNHLSLPDIDLSNLVFNWPRIIAAAALFTGSILLLSGFMVAIGAAVPTAKEAGQFFGVVMTMIFVPLYAAPLFITSPDSLAVTILTFFPLTAPIPLLIRNAIGNLTTAETIIGVMMLFVFAAIVFMVAARLFQTGAVEYSKKMSLKSLFGK